MLFHSNTSGPSARRMGRAVRGLRPGARGVYYPLAYVNKSAVANGPSEGVQGFGRPQPHVQPGAMSIPALADIDTANRRRSRLVSLFGH